MATSDRMPKVDLAKDFPQVKRIELDYMKKIEKENLERVLKIKKLKKRNIGTGILLAGGVLGVYFYSMFAVKQEKFLDELDTT